MNDFADALSAMLEQIAPVRVAAQGYREQLRRDGWSDPVAEQMAMVLHNQLVVSCFAGMARGARP